MPNRWKPNVTVAALIEREGRFLLVEEETTDGLKLNNPAGHLDPGESPIQACAADRDGLQGANRSDSRSYREDLQRRRPPEAADAGGAAICAEHP